MPSPLLRVLRRPAGDPSFFVFLVTVVLCLLRAEDLPSLDFDAVGTTFSIGLADLALLATALLAVLRLRARGVVPSPWLLAATMAFALLVVVSSLPNSAGAFTAAAKTSELAALTLGAVAFLDSRERLAALAELIVAYTAVAVLWGLTGFVVGGGGRQGSFLGEHDLAAVGAMSVAFGLAHLHNRPGRPPFSAIFAIAVGSLGLVLGASLASVLGLYLVAGAVLALAWARHSLRLRAVLVTLGVAAVVTAGTYALRAGDLTFLDKWFGPAQSEPGQYAASWTHRLVVAYIGGRVFLDHPVLGTGWQGELPPGDYVQYLPDAHARFSDQPANYFPARDGTLIPQQAYDQVLFQLGLVGGVLFLALLVVAGWHAVRTGLAWPGREAFSEQAYVPLAWFASIAGALAGAALFGGAPITAIFWLTLGVVAAGPALLLPRPAT